MLRTSRRLFCRSRLLVPLCAIVLTEMVLPSGTSFARPPVPYFSGEELFRGLLLMDGPASDLIPEIRDQIRPPLDKRNPRLARAVALFQDQLLDALNLRDPSFFGAFAESVRSGDHLRIQTALIEAARVTAAVLRENPVAQALGREIKEDPGKRQAFLEALRETPAAQGLSETERVQVVETLAWLSVDDSASGPNPYTVDSSIVAVLVTVAAVVAAVTVVLAQSYAAVLNVAGAINFYLAIVATSTITVTKDPVIEAKIPTLLQEQMVDSIATTFRR